MWIDCISLLCQVYWLSYFYKNNIIIMYRGLDYLLIRVFVDFACQVSIHQIYGFPLGILWL